MLFRSSVLLLLCSNCMAEPDWEGAFDTISISADQAREDAESGVLHLDGNFVMQSEKWRLTSLRATVHGNPTRPDQILLEGNPARFTFLSSDPDVEESIEATALEVVYRREENSLLLSGDARLKLGDETVQSKQISYDIASGRFLAGGDEGVIIRVPPRD